MRLLALRTLFAGLLISTVAGKIWLARADLPDIRAGAIETMLRQGWVAYEETGNHDQPLGNAVNFRAVECEALGQLFIVGLNLQAAPMLDHITKPGYARRFIYLGRTWLNQDRFGMRLEWLKHKIFGLVGLGQYEANESAIVIVEPPDCKRAETVDWSRLWELRPQKARLPTNNL